MSSNYIFIIHPQYTIGKVYKFPITCIPSSVWSPHSCTELAAQSLHQVRLRTFEFLKPHFVSHLKNRCTCYCIYHVQMGFLNDFVNLLWHHNSSLQDAICTRECPICQSRHAKVCRSSEHVYVSMSCLLDSILCPRESETINHNYKCVMGLCQDCGSSRFRWSPKELSSEIGISVKLFEYVDTKLFQRKGM